MKRTGLIVFVVMAALTVSVWGGDWPQFLGPDRNATSLETGLARVWPEEGPKVQWTVPLGSGYGAPAVFDGKIYILDRVDSNQDVIRCLDLATGKEEWNFTYDAPGRISHAGSRSVPAVDKQRIYTCGPHGDVYCIDKKTHKPLWNRKIRDGFGEDKLPRWGFSQSPLLYKDMVIVAPMAPEAGVAALDRVTGKVRWTSPPLSGAPGYVSPAIVKIGGMEQIVMISAMIMDRRGGRGRDRSNEAPQPIDESKKGAVVGINPENGKQLWIYKGWQCRIPIPNVVPLGDGRLFITGGYEAGSAMIRVDKTGQTYTVKELYKTQDFGVHIHQPVLYKGHLYGHGTTNTRRDSMTCMNVDGKVQWKTERSPVFDKGGFILADNLIFSVDGKVGDLYLIEPSSEGFKPLSKVNLLDEGESWAPLTLVDGKLLIRDQGQMKCVLVR